MNILKCKICGGDIEITANENIGTCQYCGTTITLPRLDSDKKSRLFNRAHQYRLNCEFDNAFDAYQAITLEDETEAEAYWGMLLSEYGVEYVEDPKTGKRIPTCHRTNYNSVLNSTNYQLACQYAEAESKFMYQDEAKVLDGIQKKIIAISSKEEPYDVFICYKETDEAGERTEDSVLAQDIYEALTDKGIKVFFARITLEDKLGQDYEPYIYAALRSAKVMIMVTTSSGNCEAIWVRNEWSRFIGMMAENKEKILVPAYKGISPYELPAEFAKFQAQDMGKVGAIQDLCRAVKKLVGSKSSADNDAVLNKLLEENKKGSKRQKIIIAIMSAVIVALGSVYFVSMSSMGMYYRAKKAYEEGDYNKAYKISSGIINEYKDSAKMTEALKIACKIQEDGYTAGKKYSEYVYELKRIDEDLAQIFIDTENQSIIKKAQDYKNEGEYELALSMLKGAKNYVENEEICTLIKTCQMESMVGTWKFRVGGVYKFWIDGDTVFAQKSEDGNDFTDTEVIYDEKKRFFFVDGNKITNKEQAIALHYQGNDWVGEKID